MVMVQKGKLENYHIIVVAIVTALSLIGDSMLYITLPIYWKEAGLTSIWQVGFLLSFNRFVRLPANPIIGWVYKRISLKTGLVIAIVVGSVTTIGYGIVNSFIGWVILRGLWGIAWSFFRIGGLSTVVHFSKDHNRGKAMGLYNGLYRLGSLFGMLLGGFLVPFFGFSVISIIFGIVSIIGLPLILLSLKNNTRESNQLSKNTTDGKSTRNGRSTIIIIVSGFLITMLIQGILTSTLSSLIEHHYGEKLTVLGMVISVTALSGLIQSARWMWEPFLGTRFGIWSDGKRGRIPLYIGSLGSSALIFGLLSLQIPIAFWIVVVLLVMVSATALTTLTDAIAGDVAKETDPITFLTVYSIVQDVGAAIGPFAGYYLIEKIYGFQYLYWGSSVILIFLAIVWSITHANKKLSTNHAIQSNG